MYVPSNLSEGCFFLFSFLMLNKSRNEFVIVKNILLAQKNFANFELVVVGVL